MTTTALDPTSAAGAAATMTAILQEGYGSAPEAALRAATVAKPELTDDRVLVRVKAASVDRGTWHLMTGMPYAMRIAGFGVRRPKASNPGRAFAGVVEALGSKVTGVEVGDEVFGTCDGSFAEFVLAQPKLLARKPANLSFEQSAAAPISGVTALQAVRKAKVLAGQTVLVTGASGGVGTYAVQMVKALGATVTGVSSTAKVDLVRSLGADHVLDYTIADFTDGTHTYDAIIDTGGARRLSHLRRALRPHGTLVIVGGETGGRWLGGFDRSLRAGLVSPFVSQTLTMLTSKENTTDLDALRQLIEAGQVSSSVERSYPLREAAAAIRHLMDGDVRGKVVITV